jgi:hypothetical protein
VKAIKEEMANYKAQNPMWKRMDLAFRHLGFGIWISV